MSYTKGMSHGGSKPASPLATGANGGPADASGMTPAASASSAPAASNDVVLLGPPTADGAGVHVIRAREEGIETGELRALQEGRPITGEIVTLKPRKENPRICDVADSYSPSSGSRGAQGAGHKGPARVASKAYREGWDEIFGSSSTSGKSGSDLN